MKPTETVLLTEYVKACCPQQARTMGEYTPDAWHDLLGDLSLADCREAVAAVARRQPFVAPAEIRTEVRRIRDGRIARSVLAAPPPELTDDPAAYRRALAEGVQQAADGIAAPQGDQRAITGGQPQPERRTHGRPAALRTALAEFRSALGPARLRRAAADLPEIAREQAAYARSERDRAEAVRRGTEEAS